jgi:hypothetical protein
MTPEQLLAELDRYALAADREPQRVTANVCAVFSVDDDPVGRSERGSSHS